jgi:hypothetical protein
MDGANLQLMSLYSDPTSASSFQLNKEPAQSLLLERQSENDFSEVPIPSPPRRRASTPKILDTGG